MRLISTCWKVPHLSLVPCRVLGFWSTGKYLGAGKCHLAWCWIVPCGVFASAGKVLWCWKVPLLMALDSALWGVRKCWKMPWCWKVPFVMALDSAMWIVFEVLENAIDQQVLENATDQQVLESATFEFGAGKCYWYWCWRVPCRLSGFWSTGKYLGAGKCHLAWCWIVPCGVFGSAGKCLGAGKCHS